jgi:hypothetical protein
MLRRLFAATTIILGATHLAAYAASGWVARTLLVHRTLDGEPQTEARWIALLHAITLRSGVVVLGVLAVAAALLAARRTREEIFGYFSARRGPVNLAVFRVFLFGSLFLVFDGEQTAFFAGLPSALVLGLPDPLPLWRLILPSPALTAILVPVFRACCLLACAGLFTRAASIGVCVLGFYLLGLPQVYGKVDHYHHLLWFAVVLACSPAGDALGVDALLRPRREPSSVSVAYALPLRIIWLLFGVMYFWPGFWKLVQHGPAWVLAANFRSHLYLKWFEDQTFVPLFRIDHYPWLCVLGSVYAIVFELSFAFLILFRRTRPLAVVMGLAFHNATYLLMNISFLSLQLCYAALIDWEGVAGWLKKRAPALVGALERRAAAAVARAREVLGTRAPALLDERRVARRLAVAGAVLLGVNLVYGAMHQTDAWPFACYPTFSTIIKPQHRSLVVTIVDAVTGERSARTATLLEAFRSERYAAVVRGILHERSEARRQRKLEALAGIVRSLEPTVKPGDVITIGEAVFSTNPEVARAPQRQERLYAFQVRDEGVTWMD